MVTQPDKNPLSSPLGSTTEGVSPTADSTQLQLQLQVADYTKTIPTKAVPPSGIKAWMQMFADQNEEEEEDYLSDSNPEDGFNDINNGGNGYASPSEKGGGAMTTGTEVGGSSPARSVLASNTPLAITAVETSRYKLEFSEISVLGKGASGEVWKAKNKLDRQMYAVKKINLSSKENKTNYNKIRREVTTISGLLHKYIVRYYAAWIEQQETAVGPASSRSRGRSNLSGNSDDSDNSMSLSEDETSSLENTTSSRDDSLLSPAYQFNSVNIEDSVREIDHDTRRKQRSGSEGMSKKMSSLLGTASDKSPVRDPPTYLNRNDFSFSFDNDHLFDYPFDNDSL
eukprot:gene26957-33609_t